MGLIDIIAGAAFVACWLIYEPLLERSAGGRGAINIDMRAVREGWLRRMLARENRMFDASLLGQQLNSASFFASTNLLVIAAVAGLLFGGEAMLANVGGLAIAHAPPWLMQIKIALVAVVLSMGLLDFIWSIRQLNYCLALYGAAPEASDAGRHERYLIATLSVLDPAYLAFNRGVRAYYFALAAAAWIISPWAMLVAVIAAFTLLMRRQTSSKAAVGLREARRVLEEMQRRPED